MRKISSLFRGILCSCFALIFLGSISVSADTFVSYDIKTQKKEVKNIEAEENSIKEMLKTNNLEKQNRSVIGEKVLFPVYENESKKPPYSAICYMESFWNVGGKKYAVQGTGTLVMPDKVLTAGHLLYDYNYGPADEIYVYPGRYKSIYPYGEARGIKIHYPQDLEKLNYSDSSTLDYRKCDIGVVDLNIPIGNTLVCHTITFCSDSDLMGAPTGHLTITGYPKSGYALGYYDEITGSSNTIQGVMYSSWGRATRCSGREILYNIDTYPGMDGAAIMAIQPWSGMNMVVGVDVSYPRETKEYNVGVHIEQQYYLWLQSLGAA